jgi:hypothetical protein
MFDYEKSKRKTQKIQIVETIISMKKLLLIIFGFLIINSLLAQPIGDKWYYDYQTPVSTGYTLIEYTNDTIINSSQYRILNKTQFTYNFPGFYDTTELNCEYIKWNSDTVYRYLDGNDYVLYNFNKNVGDTICFYYKSSFSACDSIGKAIVDSVGYINIASVSRKWISVSCFSNSHLCINGKIVEGIGPIEDYFFPEIYNCVIDVNEGGPFRCLWDESNLIFIKTTAQCDYINCVEDPNDMGAFSLYPIPFTKEFRICAPKSHENININEFLEATITAYDILGNTIVIQYVQVLNDCILVSCYGGYTGILIIRITLKRGNYFLKTYKLNYEKY